MRYSIVVTVLSLLILPAAAAAMPQECLGASAAPVGQGKAGKPVQIQHTPKEEAPELTPEERQRLEQAIERTHLRGPRPSKKPADQPDPGPELVAPTSPWIPSEPEKRGSGEENDGVGR